MTRPTRTVIECKSGRTGRSGTTLVEVMVVYGIIAVLTTGIFSLFLTSLKSWDTGSSKTLSDNGSSLALQKAIRAISDGMSATVSSGTLTVQFPAVNDQGDYNRSSNGATVKLYLTGTTLYEQVNSGTAVSLMKDISAATFTVSGSTVTLAITGQGQTGDNLMQTQLTQVVTLRNAGTF